MNSLRLSLTLLWSVSFVAGMLAWAFLKWIVSIGPEASASLLEQITSQYAPYLGAVLAFHFAARGAGKPTQLRRSPSKYLALVMSALWNLLFLGFIAKACWDPNTTTEAADNIKVVIPKLSWIVAPAIGFFFGRAKEP